MLVVGAGNTGAQLAVELHRAGRRVTLSASKAPWFVPTHPLGVGLYPLLRGSGLLAARPGGRAYRWSQERGEAVVGTALRELLRAREVELRPRATGAAGHVVSFADGGSVRAQAVLWATGYRPALDWIDVPGALDAAGRPVHARGVSPVGGLVWLGLPWQRRMDSGIIHGAPRDARALVRVLRQP